MARYIELAPQLVRLYRLNLDCEEVIKEFLLTAVTADVRENIHAHWDKVEMKRGEWWHTCSKCKATWGSEEGELDFNYCPNCGAEMVGEKDE